MNHVHALCSARTGKEKGRQGGADGWSHGRRKQGVGSPQLRRTQQETGICPARAAPSRIVGSAAPQQPDRPFRRSARLFLSVPSHPCAESSVCRVIRVPSHSCAESFVCRVIRVPSHPCAESFVCRVIRVPSHPCAESFVCRVIRVPSHSCAESSVCRVIRVPSHSCAESSVCRVIRVPSHSGAESSVCQVIQCCLVCVDPGEWDVTYSTRNRRFPWTRNVTCSRGRGT
jgi:hypothetical protein